MKFGNEETMERGFAARRKAHACEACAGYL